MKSEQGVTSKLFKKKEKITYNIEKLYINRLRSPIVDYTMRKLLENSMIHTLFFF